MNAGPLIRRLVTHPSLVVVCTLLSGLREVLALKRLRWSEQRRLSR